LLLRIVLTFASFLVNESVIVKNGSCSCSCYLFGMQRRCLKLSSKNKKGKKVNTISFWFKYRDTITMQMRKNLIVRYKWYNMEWLSEYNHLRLIAKENAIEAPKLLTIFWMMKNSGDTLFLKVPCLKESKF
jgi:hypothetical protein